MAAQKAKKEKYEYINKGIFKTTKKKMYTWRKKIIKKFNKRKY